MLGGRSAAWCLARGKQCLYLTAYYVLPYRVVCCLRPAVCCCVVAGAQCLVLGAWLPLHTHAHTHTHTTHHIDRRTHVLFSSFLSFLSVLLVSRHASKHKHGADSLCYHTRTTHACIHCYCLFFSFHAKAKLMKSRDKALTRRVTVIHGSKLASGYGLAHSVNASSVPVWQHVPK